MKPVKSCLALLLLAASLVGAAADDRPQRETPGQYIDDATITAKVKGAFVQDSKVNALSIKVETYRGTVQLAGFASSQDEIERAVRLARSVPGVADVKNDIRLAPARP